MEKSYLPDLDLSTDDPIGKNRVIHNVLKNAAGQNCYICRIVWHDPCHVETLDNLE